MSAFDPTAFEAVSTEPLSTSVTPIPKGEHAVQIEDYKFSPGTSRKDGKSYMALDITYRFFDDDGSLAQLLGREPKLTKAIFLDVSPQGGLDMTKGKNIQLGKIREALNQNIPGQPWSLPMIKGQPLRILVTEDPAPDSDAVYNSIKAWGRFA